MPLIQKINAREILDSRGHPTLEVELKTKSHTAKASVPSGASKGSFEAHELRDQDQKRWQGLGVLKSIHIIQKKIKPKIVGKKIHSQEEIDSLLNQLDGSKNKSSLGANTLLGLSLAFSKLKALEASEPLYENFRKNLNSKDLKVLLGHLKETKDQQFRLPVPLMNVLNGGVHANNGLEIQEFMIVPNFGNSFKEALRAGSEIFYALKSLLKEKNLSTAVGDEGGFAPHLKSNQDALELLMMAIKKTKYQPGEEIFIALDVASNEFFKKNKYFFEKNLLTGEELGNIFSKWARNFPIISFEDPFSENDWETWSKWTKTNYKKFQIVGDDLFVTHPERIKKGLKLKSATASLIKMNQIGSLSETKNSVLLSKKGHLKTIFSHRSGETEDTSLADLSIALNCEQIKAGAPCRGERTAKYNQLLRIEESLNKKAQYWGAFGIKAFL